MQSASPCQWLSLVATFWLQSVNGPNSDFPVYSSHLKTLIRISQVDTNLLAFASDAGKLLGWLPGVAALFLPLWLVALIGAALELLGYGLQFLFLQNPGMKFYQLFALTAVAGNGICWTNTVCYLISIRNFGAGGRAAVGLSASYAGLSAKVYAVVVSTVFGQGYAHDAGAYLLVNAVVPMIVTVSVAPFLRVVKGEFTGRAGDGLVAMFVIAAATGVCAVVASVDHSLRLDIGLGLLLAAPLIVPLVMGLKRGKWCGSEETRVHDVAVGEGEERACDVEAEAARPRVKEDLEMSKEVGGVLILRQVNFWLYFFGYMFSATLGLVFLNNLGQIAEARGQEASGLVSLSSSFGFFGRLAPFLLDHFWSRGGREVPRPALLAALTVPISGAFITLLSPNTLVLQVSTSVIGACTGAITSVAVFTTCELFGSEYFSVNHNILVTNIPVGSFVFGYFAAFVYQRAGSGGGNGVCIGPKCYDDTFIVWGIISAIGTLLCGALYLRTRR